MAFALHCGAGSYAAGPSQLAKYHALLTNAGERATHLLREGAPADFVATDVVRILEASPLTNAGPGSNLTRQGTVECDALCAKLNDKGEIVYGAVGSAPGLASPSTVAKSVMHTKPQSCVTGIDAWILAKDHGLDCAPNVDSLSQYGVAPAAQNRWLYAYQKHAEQRAWNADVNHFSDTVGCLCIDRQGIVAGCVSSGGPVFRETGRVGPAATYGAALALNANPCGVCASGDGAKILKDFTSANCLSVSQLADIVKENEALAVLRLSEEEDGFLIEWSFSSPGFAIAVGSISGNTEALVDFRLDHERVHSGFRNITMPWE